jgi:hypothetical protein
MQIQAHSLGNVSPLTAAEAELAGEYNLRPSPVSRAFEYWSARLDKAEGNWKPAKAAKKTAGKTAAKKPVGKKGAQKRRR